MASELKANAIYKIIGMNCYAVPSNSSDKMYKVCFDESATNWTCSCKHGEIQASRGLAAKCCHVSAVQISIVANKKVTKPLETSQKGHLHSAIGFSLLK